MEKRAREAPLGGSAREKSRHRFARWAAVPSVAGCTRQADVENEANGFLGYDRRLVRAVIPVVAERDRAVIAAGSAGVPDIGRWTGPCS